MMWEMHLYRVSADGGTSWTEQWLTDAESEEEKGRGLICERACTDSFKQVFA